MSVFCSHYTGPRKKILCLFSLLSKASPLIARTTAKCLNQCHRFLSLVTYCSTATVLGRGYSCQLTSCREIQIPKSEPPRCETSATVEMCESSLESSRKGRQLTATLGTCNHVPKDDCEFAGSMSGKSLFLADLMGSTKA